MPDGEIPPERELLDLWVRIKEAETFKDLENLVGEYGAVTFERTLERARKSRDWVERTRLEHALAVRIREVIEYNIGKILVGEEVPREKRLQRFIPVGREYLDNELNISRE